MKKWLHENKYYLIIFLISIIICGYIFGGEWYYGHDIAPHIARTAGVLISIADGQIIPTIIPNFCNSFGYSWNLFYGPLFAYLAAFLAFALNNFFMGIKIAMFLTVFLSGITMFNFINYVSKNKKLAFIVSVIYICAPYRLIEIYTRAAIGEMMAFIFFPILFQGLYNLFNEVEKRKSYLICIGLVGTILSHNISAIMIGVGMMLYILVNIDKVFKNIKIFKILCINAIFVILISGFFVFPLIQSKMATDYKMLTESRFKVKNHGATWKELLTYKVFNGGSSISIDLNDPKEVLTGKQMNHSIGIFIIIPLAFIPFVLVKIPKKQRRNYIFLCIIGIISIILCTQYFPWDKMPKIFDNILQFPWRMLMMVVTTLSIVAGINVYILLKGKNIYIVLFVLLILVNIMNLLVPEKKLSYSAYDKYFENDTIYLGKLSSSATANFDYLPMKAVQNSRYLVERTHDPIVLEGVAEVSDISKKGTKMEFEVKNAQKNTKIELPYIYYIGYNIKIVGLDGQEEKLKSEESDNGFVCFNLNKITQGTVYVKYTGTILMNVSAIVSIISLIGFIIIIKVSKKNEQNTFN